LQALSEYDPMTLPAIAEWAAAFDPPMDLGGYIGNEVSIAQAVAVVSLIFPALTRVGDGVFLSDQYSEETHQQWATELGGDSSRIEEMLNHLHLWDFFTPTTDAEEQALAALADAMVIGWKARATAMFPDREFQVRVTDDYGPTVIMHSSPRIPPSRITPG
jgi:hypothetical protein